MERFKDLVSVEWSNKLVLTTAQLAEYYECEVNNIKKNFNANRDRFKESKHYYRLQGADLAAFKLQVTESDLQNLQVTESGLQISPMTRTLYLWTERGAARHAKMLSTDKAWEVFEALEDNYFSRNISEVIVKPAKKKRTPNPNRRAGQLSDASVYVFQMSDGSIIIVKIGQSKDVNKRKASIERDTKKTVKKTYYTPLLPRKIARLIEKACHEIFSSSKLGGEFFSVEYEEACKVIDAFVTVVACLQISDVERGEKLLAIVNEIKTLSANQTEERTILISSAKLIAGN